ncbi:MAG: hypothetical protein AMK69_22110, partial [Nitrospira bacterium SG8_3]
MSRGSHILVGVLLAVMLLWACPLAARGATGEIYVVKVAGTINPGLAEYLIRSMEQASREEAGCLVIQLDTPGGLALSMRSIVMAMLS